MTISSARNGTLPTCAHFNDVMMTFASAVNALPSLWPSVTTTPSRPALSLAANLTQRHSARQKLAASRAVICGNRRNRMVRRPCGDGTGDHGEARGRALHLRKITGGRQDPRMPERPPPVQRSWLSLPPRGCRRRTRLAIATTPPRVIALGSVCAVRAPGIVARDGGDRCRARPDVRAPGRAGTSCRRQHRMPDDDHKASKGVDHGRFRALHRFRDSRTRP